MEERQNTKVVRSMGFFRIHFLTIIFCGNRRYLENLFLKKYFLNPFSKFSLGNLFVKKVPGTLTHWQFHRLASFLS